jgi:hypothetical protein
VTWVSKFNSSSVNLLVRQLMAIIQRDQRAALDQVAGAGVLPDITGYYFTERPFKQFPSLMLRVLRTEWQREESPMTRQGTHIMACAVGVQNQDPEPCAELMEDYVEALNTILESIQPGDFRAALTLTHPMYAGGSVVLSGIPTGVEVTSIFVQSHDYSALAKLRDGFGTAGIITFEVDTQEGFAAA